MTTFDKENMNFYPFHIGDYISHTSHLSDAEDLAYRRMIDYYYQSEKPLFDIDFVARKIKSTPQIVEQLLFEFFEETPHGYINKRCDEEIAKYHAMQEGGRKGAAKRWGKGSDNPPIATPMPTKNQEPRTNNHIYTDDFEKFWSEYPNKTGKGGAYNSWKKIKVTDELLQSILKSITLYKQTKQVKEGYIKNPQTWLNNRCWEDEIVTATSNEDSSRFGNIFASVRSK